jgi:hypothetical protein
MGAVRSRLGNGASELRLSSVWLNHDRCGSVFYRHMLGCFTKRFRHSPSRHHSLSAMSGGLAALLAVNVFPLVKYATGIPACVVAGTGYPLSLYYAYVAVVLSLATVPLGVFVGKKVLAVESRFIRSIGAKTIQYVVSPATIVLCLLITILIRSI